MEHMEKKKKKKKKKKKNDRSQRLNLCFGTNQQNKGRDEIHKKQNKIKLKGPPHRG